MHLADSVRQKAMRIFTRLTRHIDIRFGFNFGRVPRPLHDGTLITFGRSFFPFFRVTSASVRNIGRAGVVVSQNEKKEERLSLLPILGFFRPLCVHRMGRRQWITYHLEGCRPRRVARLLARSI